MDVKERVAHFKRATDRLGAEVAKIIVGQEPIVEGVITALIAGGHALLEGVPGLGKTRLVRTLAAALDLDFARVQFTPDLMPTDITGTKVAFQDDSGHTALEFQKGPIFAHIILADEINRATPRTQSAMLEAMQERSVTVGRVTHQLDEPFFVLATQNPLEMEGTYPLPEAQLDRFLFKLHVAYPSSEELHTILDRTTGWEAPAIEPVMDKAAVLALRHLAMDVPIARHVQDYAVRLVMATHPEHQLAPEVARRYIRVGASPRGAQAMIVAAKVKAVLGGRFAVSVEDLRDAAKPALRHRIIRNFEGEAEGVCTDAILDDILRVIKVGG
ncbi:MAG: AAA family ATPase [Proteobacteria bacterium]|nr:MAG: AAA family ATPase [Pseudomonadota bacterium]